MNNKFVRLKTGEIFILYSDNTEEETMDLIPRSQWTHPHYGGYDSTTISCTTCKYEEILVVDSNLAIVYSCHEGLIPRMGIRTKLSTMVNIAGRDVALSVLEADVASALPRYGMEGSNAFTCATVQGLINKIKELEAK